MILFHPKKWAAILVPIPRVVRALPVSVTAWFPVRAPIPSRPSPVTNFVVPCLENYKKEGFHYIYIFLKQLGMYSKWPKNT